METERRESKLSVNSGLDSSRASDSREIDGSRLGHVNSKDLIVQIEQGVNEAFIPFGGKKLDPMLAKAICVDIASNLDRVVPKIDHSIAAYETHIDALIWLKDRFDDFNVNFKINLK